MVQQMESPPELIEATQVKKMTTFNLPLPIYRWLKEEAVKRQTDMTALLVAMVRKEQDAAA